MHSEDAASQPLPVAQPQHNDHQAVRDAVQQRDERRWQLFCNRSRNEQQAQQEQQLLQNNEMEEESDRFLEHRELIRRQQRLEELIRRQQRLEEASNNMSRQDLAVYEAHNP